MNRISHYGDVSGGIYVRKEMKKCTLFCIMKHVAVLETRFMRVLTCKNEQTYQVMSRILDNLYLGNQADTRKFCGDLIISIGCNSKQPTGTIQNKKFSIKDSPSSDITPLLDPVCEMIHENLSKGDSVLIHCKAGINRSPAFVMAYLVKYHDMTLEEAQQHVSVVRKVNYKANFMKQIEAWCTTAP